MRPIGLLACLMLAVSPALADVPASGQYRLAEGPDVAGELILTADGRFEYGLAAGALDEQAQGRWIVSGSAIRLYTEPTPVPAVFAVAPPVKVADEFPTLLVTWPSGQGIAGVDFRIGFDSGDPVTGYTQDYGWTIPEEEKRIPRWIELIEPIHNIASPRFPVEGSAFRFILTPNDLGTVDFQGALAERTDDGLTLHREGGDMKFVKSGH